MFGPVIAKKCYNSKGWFVIGSSMMLFCNL